MAHRSIPHKVRAGCMRVALSTYLIKECSAPFCAPAGDTYQGLKSDQEPSCLARMRWARS
eukprot:6463239-Amphidinium_carterae.1